MKHQGLPVPGYREQSAGNVALVTENKILEERVLRQIDAHVRNRESSDVDQRMVALARTKAQEAFMWLNRAVFQPSRVALPEDEAVEAVRYTGAASRAAGGSLTDVGD